MEQNNHNNLTEIEKVNANTFSAPITIKQYNEVGLAKYEEYLIKKFFKGKRVLDIGCGCGRTTMPLSQMGFEVIGIDLVPEMIAVAQNKFLHIDFRIMNACNLEFPDEHFDNVLFSFNGIDNIYPNKKRLIALKEIYRVLKPGGTFLFTSHNACCLPYNRYLMGIFVHNLISLRIFTGYRLETLSYGQIIQHYVNPLLQKRCLKKIGFHYVKIFSRNFSDFLDTILLDPFPAYVAIK
ncbi:MAG: class I SAM-dependent methyltransferase [Planctomycetota bacterium]